MKRKAHVVTEVIVGVGDKPGVWVFYSANRAQAKEKQRNTENKDEGIHGEVLVSQQEVELDEVDAVEELRQQYDGISSTGWGEHPEWSMSEWREDVHNHDTRLGYWEWVLHQIESHETDEVALEADDSDTP